MNIKWSGKVTLMIDHIFIFFILQLFYFFGAGFYIKDLKLALIFSSLAVIKMLLWVRSSWFFPSFSFVRIQGFFFFSLPYNRESLYKAINNKDDDEITFPANAVI